MVHGDSGGAHWPCLVAVVKVTKTGRRCVGACVCLVHGGGSDGQENQPRKAGTGE